MLANLYACHNCCDVQKNGLNHNYNTFLFYNTGLNEDSFQKSQINLENKNNKVINKFFKIPSFKAKHSKNNTIDNYTFNLWETRKASLNGTLNRTLIEETLPSEEDFKTYYSHVLDKLPDNSPKAEKNHVMLQAMLNFYMQRALDVVFYRDIIDNLNKTKFPPLYKLECEKIIMEAGRQHSQMLTNNQNMPIEEYNKNIKFMADDNDTEQITKLLKLGGINTIDQLHDFISRIRINNKNGIFGLQSLKSLDIYSKTDKKSNFSQFTEYLIYLYNKTENKSEFNPNLKLEFLTKNLGLIDIDDFDNKFAHLKKDFNDFSTISDKAEAIDYLQAAYDKKIEFIKNIIGEPPKNIYTDASKLYFDKTKTIKEKFKAIEKLPVPESIKFKIHKELVSMFQAKEFDYMIIPLKIKNQVHEEINEQRELKTLYPFLCQNFPEQGEEKLKRITKNTYGKLNEQRQKSILFPTAENIYLNHCDIIDTLYKNNQGQNLNPLNLLIDTLKVPDSPIKISKNSLFIINNFNGLNDVNDKIDLLQFLLEYKTNVDDLNAISDKKTVISNDNIFECIQNKNNIINEIKKSTNKNFDEAEKSFNDFFDLYNVIYNDGNFNTHDFDVFAKILDTFNINQNKGILKLYNKVNFTDEKNLSEEQFKKFIDLMTFYDFPSDNKTTENNKIKGTKKNNQQKINIPKRETLELKKLNIEKQIKDFIDSDKYNFLLGKSTKDIYLAYKDIINKNPQDISGVLQSIKTYDNENISQMLEFKNQFFSNIKFSEFNDFILQNNIKFNNSANNISHITHCSTLLETARFNPSAFDYLTHSTFLGESKKLLGNFINHYQKGVFLSPLNIIADKKVPSLKALNNYADNEGNYDNVIRSLKRIPKDMDFKEFDDIISNSNKLLKKFNFTNILINNKNINNIDFKLIRTSKGSDCEKLNNIISPDYNKTGENFIANLPEAMTEIKTHYSNVDIADDIVKNIIDDFVSKKQLSYKNIISKFNIETDIKAGKENDYKDYVVSQLPKEFIDLVNDDSWLQVNGKTPNISKHARLRLIERFAFQNDKTGERIYDKSTKEYLNNILKTIYTQIPSSINLDKENHINVLNNKINAIFNNDGKMITIYPC